MIVLIVHAWNTQCGACRYGGGSWADSPARDGKPILTPDSRECPDCGVVFTHVQNMNASGGPMPIKDAA